MYSLHVWAYVYDTVRNYYKTTARNYRKLFSLRGSGIVVDWLSELVRVNVSAMIQWLLETETFSALISSEGSDQPNVSSVTVLASRTIHSISQSFLLAETFI